MISYVTSFYLDDKVSKSEVPHPCCEYPPVWGSLASVKHLVHLVQCVQNHVCNKHCLRDYGCKASFPRKVHNNTTAIFTDTHGRERSDPPRDHASINAYHPVLAYAWGANTDIQSTFTQLDSSIGKMHKDAQFAVATYVCCYTSKNEDSHVDWRSYIVKALSNKGSHPYLSFHLDFGRFMSPILKVERKSTLRC